MTSKRVGERLLSLPRVRKQAMALMCDAAACVLAMLVAFYLRLGEMPEFRVGVWFSLVFAPVIALPIFHFFGLYRAVFRHVGSHAMLLVTYAVGAVAIPTLIVFTLISIPGVPRTMGVIQPVILVQFILLTRLVAREWFSRSGTRRAIVGRVAIYGAGSTGRQVAMALSATREMIVTMFIDDDPALQGQTLNGVPIKSLEDAIVAVGKGVLTDILFAMPGALRQRRNQIVSQLRGLAVRVRTVPAISDLAQGRVDVRDLRDLDIDDLLSRETVSPEGHLLGRTIAARVVMVTGAGGSIGSELCRQIVQQSPTRLLLVEQNEFALYRIHAELEQSMGPEIEIVPLLASVRDRDRIVEIVRLWRPHTVFHAAAYKHVPLVEHNVVEGVANNVFGTRIVAEVSAEFGVDHFVLISTDKAVRPTNVMGATKRLAEMILQIAARGRPSTRFSMVRFGNVLNSSGSVVPLFRRQISEGGPITITHPDITRFFMTIPEAAQLVIQTAGLAKGGEVFVLDMGEPVRIYDLACSMISLSGLTLRDEGHPGGDIAIEVIGLRPGEKLYEELLIGNNPMPTDHRRIMMANEPLSLTTEDFHRLLAVLADAVQRRDVVVIRSLLVTLVTDYKPDIPIVDWTCGSATEVARRAEAIHA